jgi:N utilization substance protein A
MAMIKLSGNVLQYITLFENTTGVKVRDCIDYGEQLIYMIERGQLRRALGKKSQKLKLLKATMKKNIDIIEYSSEPTIFVKNIFHKFKIYSVALEVRNNKHVVIVNIDPREKARAIGKFATNLQVAKTIMKRHHSHVDDIIIL